MTSFKDIGKATQDIFDPSDGYDLNREIEISANEDNVNLTATTTLENDGGVLTEVEYSQGNFIVTLDTESNQSVTYKNLKFAGLSAKLKFNRNAGKGSNDDLEATIKKKGDNYNVQFKVKADSNVTVKTDTQFVFQKDSLVAGVRVPFAVQKGFDASKIGLALSYGKGDNTFVLTSTNPLAQNMAFSFLRNMTPDISAAVGVNYSPDSADSENSGVTFNAGANFKLDDKSSFRGFTTGTGDIRAQYAYAFSRRLKASAAFGTSINNPFNISTGFKLKFQ